MDYKRFIQSRTVRTEILHALDFIPDGIMLKLQYRIKTGRKLNLRDPKRYTEKIQWYKLNYKDPLMRKCADKYEVRSYVKDCGLESILTPIYGIYNTADEVKWDELPHQFVAKSTLGSGGNEVIICQDKSELHKEEFYKAISGWLSPIKRKNAGREWVYESGSPRILIEKYIPSVQQMGGLGDYRFFCFYGNVSCLYVLTDMKLGGKHRIGFFSPDFQELPVKRLDELPLNRKIPRPENFDELLKDAQILSKPFPHARIDLYDQDGEIYFGEITFFGGSGYMQFEPDDFDYKLGEQFILPNHHRQYIKV